MLLIRQYPGTTLLLLVIIYGLVSCLSRAVGG